MKELIEDMSRSVADAREALEEARNEAARTGSSASLARQRQAQSEYQLFRSAFETRTDSPGETPEVPQDPCQHWRGILRFRP